MAQYGSKAYYDHILKNKAALEATKPRTPADIGRDIAAAEQRIRDLKAELSDVPPKVLELSNVIDSGTVTFEQASTGALDVTSSAPGPLNILRPELVAKLRDWLNYYFPKEA